MTLWCPRLHSERGRAALSLFALKRLWLGEHTAAEDMLKVKPGDTEPQDAVEASDTDGVGLEHTGKNTPLLSIIRLWKGPARQFYRARKVDKGKYLTTKQSSSGLISH